MKSIACAFLPHSVCIHGGVGNEMEGEVRSGVMAVVGK
jgi:hypothetical protein